MPHYNFRASVRLSKNYNSIEVSAEFGREAGAKEKPEDMIDEVESVVWERLNTQLAKADGLLSSQKKG